MTKIAIQGIQGCFHEMAARKHFSSGDTEFIECNTFRQLCESLKEGKCDKGIMAIENTLAGSLLPNYSLLSKYKLFISGEVYLRIQLHLMAIPGAKLNDVRTVMSHPVALAQCEDFLDTLGDIEIREYHDTAAAAKWIAGQKMKDIAAVSNELSSELYGLNILERNIETHKENYTRFLVLDRDMPIIENANKASLSLEVSHQPGSLVEVLKIFSDYKLNLTKIQSLPIIGKPYQYAFKVDLTFEKSEYLYAALQDETVMESHVTVQGIYREGSYL